jgi:hypothetical protein
VSISNLKKQFINPLTGFHIFLNTKLSSFHGMMDAQSQAGSTEKSSVLMLMSSAANIRE